MVLDDRAGFEDAVRKVIAWVSFDVNTKPQIFEANIRVLGGLLSAHIFANRTGQPFHLPWYQGELLSMAHDLGERFLPAFSTPTGLPYARVSDTDSLDSALANGCFQINLRHGIPTGESVETCKSASQNIVYIHG